MFALTSEVSPKIGRRVRVTAPLHVYNVIKALDLGNQAMEGLVKQYVCSSSCAAWGCCHGRNPRKGKRMSQSLRRWWRGRPHGATDSRRNAVSLLVAAADLSNHQPDFLFLVRWRNKDSGIRF
jgi:hypothetical protein